MFSARSSRQQFHRPFLATLRSLATLPALATLHSLHALAALPVLVSLFAIAILAGPRSGVEAAAPSGDPPAKRPNIVLIMADDFGYECVGANGGQSYRTPNLDRLAARGVRFEQCHVQPLCTPTRVQLMTGLHNVRNYVQFGLLPRSETTFGHLFQKAGYRTAVCGKWQLGREPDSPKHFGFDESYLWQHTRRPPRYANPGLEHNGRELDFANGEYGPSLVQDFALDFIARHKDRPFFLYYPMLLTHSPFQPTPDSPDWSPKTTGEKASQHERHFGEMTQFMDKLVGQLDQRLADLGLRDNTLVLFLGDNGTGGGVTSRFQGREVRGGKGTTTWRGTRVPLIASWPAVIREGRVNRDLVSSVDFLPTICEAAGIGPPQGSDGVSFLPQVRGERGSPREWLYHWYSPRQNNVKKVTEFVFDHRYKLYRDGRFFDLETDPEEKSPLNAKGLAGEAAVRASKLEAALAQFRDARPAALDRPGKAATDASGD